MLTPAADASDEAVFDIWKGVYRISYESVKVSSPESMGLMGVHYLVDVAPWLSAGVSGFGAITGKRGGFFTGGLEVALRQRLYKSFDIEAGVFAGGGGGGGAPQGGGMMLRPYAGILYDWGSSRAGVQYARVDFPNGTITSDHFAFVFDIPFDLLLLHTGYDGELAPLPGRASRAAEKEAGFVRDSFTVIYQKYFPAAGTKNTDLRTRTKNFDTLGLEYARHYNDRYSLVAEAAGAVAGESEGYAELFIGAGYRRALSEAGRKRLFLDFHAAAGTAGGGGVDTGGGFALKTSLGLKYFIGPDLSTGLAGAYVAAPGGSFRAPAASFDITYLADFLSLEGKRFSPNPSDTLSLDTWEAGYSHQTYRTHDPRVRKSASDAPVSLMGLKLRKALSPSLSLTGQAWGAYDGGAGGYAVGLLGMRLTSGPVLVEWLRFFAELSAGGAGGGGIPVQGGAVLQGMTGLSLDLTRSLGMEVSYGKIEAINGILESAIVEAGLVYRFSTLCRKITWENSAR